MHKSALAQIHPDVRHFSGDLEKEQVADTHASRIDRRETGPKALRRSRYRFAGTRVRIMHQTAAVEATGRATAVPIRYADLLQGNRRRTLANICTVTRLNNQIRFRPGYSLRRLM